MNRISHAGMLALLLVAPVMPARAGEVGSDRIRVTSVAGLADALVAVRRRPPGRRGVRIELAAGRYVLAAPLLLDESMSGRPGRPVAIVAAPGARVVLSGACDLGPLVWRRTVRGIWRARVAGPTFQRLWLGDRLLVRARYPDYRPGILPYGGVAADAIDPRRVARWRKPEGARPSRSTAISAAPQGSRRCCCKARTPSFTCCPRCRRAGATDRSRGCARAVR